MRILQNRGKSEAGNLLIVTLVPALIIGTSLAAYLGLVAQQHRAIMRSLAWNAALPVVEAGFEEALSHLQWNYTNTLAIAGWQRQTGLSFSSTNISGSFFVKRIDLPGSYCTVGITDTMPPILYSEGFCRMPLSSNYLSRLVRLDTRRDSLFPIGIFTKHDMDFRGHQVQTDSFDSANPLRNNPLTANGDEGDIASNSSIVGIVNVGSARIYGRASTGPGGTVAVGGGGVGSHAWQASHKGIQPGWRAQLTVSGARRGSRESNEKAVSCWRRR